MARQSIRLASQRPFLPPLLRAGPQPPAAPLHRRRPWPPPPAPRRRQYKSSEGLRRTVRSAIRVACDVVCECVRVITPAEDVAQGKARDRFGLTPARRPAPSSDHLEDS